VRTPESPLKKPLIYLITDRRAFPEHQSIERQLDAIEIAARSGCQLIQIRERDLEARALVAFVRAAISVARPHQSKWAIASGTREQISYVPPARHSQ